MKKKELEENLNFTPEFDENGLIPCIVTCAKSGDVIMFAFMNDLALHKTIQNGEAYYWSRSRKSLWHKGSTSGYTQKIIEMRTDCDQDCIWIKVEINLPINTDTKKGASCHTGRRTCFYRQVQTYENEESQTKMKFIDDSIIFNPDEVYK